MFCKFCGSKLNNNSKFCSACGNVVSNIQKVPSSGERFGYGILGFFVPLAGIILYFMWMEEKPYEAKAAGLGALIDLIGVIAFLIIYFIIVIFAVVFAVSSTGTYY